MGPLYFVGAPDWRSALLAALFALPWLALLGRGWLRRGWLWTAAVAAAVLFPVSIAWVQVPIQQALGRLWLRWLSEDAIRRYLLLVGLPSIVVASLVQEGAKLLVAIGGLRLLGEGRKPATGLALGAAAGAGYGGMEAFWVFNQIFVAGFSWATVQLGGLGALLGFAERLYAVPFHIGSAALAGYGLASGRPWRFLLAAIALHTAVNYAVLALQAGLIGAITMEAWGALVGAATIASALWLGNAQRRRLCLVGHCQ